MNRIFWDFFFTPAYDLAVAIGAFFWLIIKRFKKGPLKPSLSERLGFSIPDPGNKAVIWIHAISVGETKAARPLFLLLKKAYPDAFFLVTQTTFTGQGEARRSLSTADAFAFLPLDFSWIMRRWVKKLKPTYFILIEGDFWWNLLKNLKAQKTKIILASGKISKKSASRFQKVPFFAKKLFGFFDLFCVQNEEQADRFASFRKILEITGNLKFDLEPSSTLDSPLNPFQKPSITIACTHAKEESMLLSELEPFFPNLSIFLAPRHPERFDEVENLLRERKISYIRWSELEKALGSETVILIDAMGKLPFCYAKSFLSIVAGSFVPHIGGHNVLEPCLYGCPSLFGPYTYSQTELSAHVLKAKAGLQIELQNVQTTFRELFENPSLLENMKEAAKHLFSSGKGTAQKTFSLLQEKRIWQ